MNLELGKNLQRMHVRNIIVLVMAQTFPVFEKELSG